MSRGKTSRIFYRWTAGLLLALALASAAFAQPPRGLPPLPSEETLAIYSLAADPSRPGVLYAAALHGGLFFGRFK